MRLLVIVLVWFAVGLLGVYSLGRRFCAKVQVVKGKTVAEQSSGYFYMGLGGGIGIYDFAVDLSNVTNCDFKQFPRVKYHIHTFAINDTDQPPKVVSCGDAGGHYDPNLACGESSEAHDKFCPALNRTAAQGYTYRCLSGVPVSKYNNPSGLCEVGDLSGKFGLATVNEDNVARPISNLTDFLPPYASNFRQSTPNITQQWANIVFHCDDPAQTRIACGDFGLICGIRRSSQAPSTEPVVCPRSC
jgi:hypothetical protein